MVQRREIEHLPMAGLIYTQRAFRMRTEPTTAIDGTRPRLLEACLLPDNQGADPWIGPASSHWTRAYIQGPDCPVLQRRMPARIWSAHGSRRHVWLGEHNKYSYRGGGGGLANHQNQSSNRCHLCTSVDDICVDGECILKVLPRSRPRFDKPSRACLLRKRDTAAQSVDRVSQSVPGLFLGQRRRRVS